MSPSATGTTPERSRRDRNRGKSCPARDRGPRRSAALTNPESCCGTRFGSACESRRGPARLVARLGACAARRESIVQSARVPHRSVAARPPAASHGFRPGAGRLSKAKPTFR